MKRKEVGQQIPHAMNVKYQQRAHYYFFIHSSYLSTIHGECTPKSIHKKKICSCRNQVLSIATCNMSIHLFQTKRFRIQFSGQKNQNKIIVYNVWRERGSGSYCLLFVILYRKSNIIYEFDCPVQWILIRIQKECRTPNTENRITNFKFP